MIFKTKNNWKYLTYDADGFVLHSTKPSYDFNDSVWKTKNDYCLGWVTCFLTPRPSENFSKNLWIWEKKWVRIKGGYNCL